MANGARAMTTLTNAATKMKRHRRSRLCQSWPRRARSTSFPRAARRPYGQNTVAVITKYVVQDGKFVEWNESEYASGKRKLPGQK